MRLNILGGCKKTLQKPSSRLHAYQRRSNPAYEVEKNTSKAVQPAACISKKIRVGQNHIYTVCIRYIWQGIHHIYGHIRCIYTVLANPKEDIIRSWKRAL